MSKIQLYKYDGMNNTINKKLGSFVSMNGDFRGVFNTFRPSITIRVIEVPTYNYCFIPDLNRYYFIDSVTFLGNSTYELSLKVDVLKSYETLILQASGTVTNSDTPDKYVSTRNSVYSRKPNFIKLDFPNTKLFNDEGTIIMITLKGTEV